MKLTMTVYLGERDNRNYTQLIQAIATSLSTYRDSVARGNEILGEDTGLVLDHLGLNIGSWEVTDTVTCAKCGTQTERRGSDTVEDWDSEGGHWYYCSEDCYETH